MTEIDNQNYKRILFVGGAPRSGTTLVQRLIGAHSQVYAGPEFDFVPKIVSLRRKMHNRIANGRISAIVDAATVDQAVRGFLHSIFDTRAERAGARLFSEKTPSNLLEFTTLAEIFPEARFVFVVRDPRAIAASMKEVARKHRAGGRRPPHFCRTVLTSAREIDRYWQEGFRAATAFPKRVMLVHYEDVVTDPEGVAQHLCSFLELPKEPGMSRIEEAEFEATETGIAGWYSKDEITAPIDRTAITRQDRALTPAEAGVVGRVIHPHPQLERYDLAGMRAGSGATLAFARLWAREKIRHTKRDIVRRIAG